MKLKKIYYMTLKKEKKLNSYYINISKSIVKKSGIDDTKEMEVIAKDKEIIIREK